MFLLLSQTDRPVCDKDTLNDGYCQGGADEKKIYDDHASQWQFFLMKLLGAVESALKALNAVVEVDVKFLYEQTLAQVKEALGDMAFHDSGDLFVGGQFTLAGNKPSAYLAKWCTELDAGRCTYAFVPRASTPQPTLVPPIQIPLLNPTISPESTEPTSTATITPIGEPTAVAPGAGGISTLWIGVLVLIFIVGCLSFILFRRA